MADPITLEVVRNALVAYADEMATVLCRTAYNMMIFEVRDYCVGIVDPEGNIIAQNTGGLPIFLADLGTAVTAAIEIYGIDGFAPGDVLVSNDPEKCGQHLNNIVVFTPFFHAGKLVAFPALRAHWIDVGGGSRGFGSTSTEEIFDEGLQLRAIKLYAAGKPNEEAIRLIRDNIRFPDSSFGDLRAQTAGCRIGELRLGELYTKYGLDVVNDCLRGISEQSDALSRAAVRAIPDGVYEAESYLDSDYVERDKTVPIKVRVIIAGDEMTVDFSDLPPQVRGPINAGASGAVAAARVAFKCIVAPDSGVTQGEFGPLKVIIPPGLLLSAVRPAPLGGWSLALPTVIDTILLALAPALPDLIPAAHKGDMSGYALYGRDNLRERPFLCMNIMGGGWGGKVQSDGVNASVSICQGNVQNAPVEVQESYYPVLIDRHELRADSGGPGRHRGGLGVEMSVAGEQEMFLNTQCQRTLMPPWGLHGGLEAKPNDAFVASPDGSRRSVVATSRHRIAPGEAVVMCTGGGGGYGDPLERDAALVAEDVREGYVGAASAERDYGVVLAANGQADIAATDRLREGRRRAPKRRLAPAG
jgi:N-methylhydantoinase B